MAGFRSRETVCDPQEATGSDFSDGFMDGGVPIAYAVAKVATGDLPL